MPQSIESFRVGVRIKRYDAGLVATALRSPGFLAQNDEAEELAKTFVTRGTTLRQHSEPSVQVSIPVRHIRLAAEAIQQRLEDVRVERHDRQVLALTRSSLLVFLNHPALNRSFERTHAIGMQGKNPDDVTFHEISGYLNLDQAKELCNQGREDTVDRAKDAASDFSFARLPEEMMDATRIAVEYLLVRGDTGRARNIIDVVGQMCDREGFSEERADLYVLEVEALYRSGSPNPMEVVSLLDKANALRGRTPFVVDLTSSPLKFEGIA